MTTVGVALAAAGVIYLFWNLFWPWRERWEAERRRVRARRHWQTIFERWLS